MTQGFYEQLGVPPAASQQEIRGAYTRAVAQLQRRRRALVEQGGDTARIDEHRAQVDEAWDVLSDPERRRRYDAMVALVDGGWSDDPAALWAAASGALIPPAATAAAELLRVGTTVAVGNLPAAPRPGGGRRMDSWDADRTQPTVVPPVSAAVVPLPTASAEPNPSAFRVVDGAAASAPVIVMPTPRVAPPGPADVGGLIEDLGYSGALLRAVRDSRGLSLQDVSDSSRISVRYLEAVESDDYERLPSATFVRGYVREMARLLDLDEERVADGYMRRYAGEA